ncbi:MAG TPA: N-acetylglucosamine-6-phosphate deacetylase [Candidatus Sulfotelmatobacter sp.]
MIVFCANRLYTPVEEIANPLVFVEDGIVSAISARDQREIPRNATVIDFAKELPESILAPGSVDIHIHGGAGVDLMRAASGDLGRLHKFLASRGVTGYFPTTVAAPLDDTCRALTRLADAIEMKYPESPDGSGAQPLGIHLEGPFLSHRRRGVHPPENLVAPTLGTFERLWEAARGHIRMMTIAPELPGAFEVIAAAATRNVCVSIGHSDADLETARAGVRAGARHATHTFNAMRPFDHRDPGIIGEVLTDKSLSADIIADGIHLAAEVVEVFLRMKGTERAVLITDAISATGMPEGTYQLGPIQVEVKDGKCTSNGSLAGSVLTMDRAVRNVMKFAGWSLQNAVRAATLNAAQTVGLTDHGRLAPGAKANFVILSGRGEVLRTICRGEIC